MQSAEFAATIGEYANRVLVQLPMYGPCPFGQDLTRCDGYHEFWSTIPNLQYPGWVGTGYQTVESAQVGALADGTQVVDLYNVPALANEGIAIAMAAAMVTETARNRELRGMERS